MSLFACPQHAIVLLSTFFLALLAFFLQPSLPSVVLFHHQTAVTFDSMATILRLFVILPVHLLSLLPCCLPSTPPSTLLPTLLRPLSARTATLRQLVGVRCTAMLFASSHLSVSARLSPPAHPHTRLLCFPLPSFHAPPSPFPARRLHKSPRVLCTKEGRQCSPTIELLLRLLLAHLYTFYMSSTPFCALVPSQTRFLRPRSPALRPPSPQRTSTPPQSYDWRQNGGRTLVNGRVESGRIG